MKKGRIGFVELKGSPKIAAVVTKKLSLEDISKIKKSGADLVELRLDSIRGVSPYEIIETIKNIKKFRMPVICTIRKDIWEKKYRENSEKMRLGCFIKLIPYVDAIDIELEANKIKKQVISIAKKRKKSIILSYHNFNEVPHKNILKKIFNMFKRSGADIFKIAGYARNIDEAMRLMAFVRKISKLYPVIGIAMGKAGKFLRIYGGFFGSSLSYAYIDKKVAPGQINLHELRRKIDEIYRE